jgi:tetratricopeptide (TPR) repeat protein
VVKTPDDARANFYLGATQVRLKEYAPARTALAKAKEKGFSAAMVDYQVGLSFALEHKWQEAKTALDQSIAANSGFAPAYFYRARVWKELKRTDEMMLDLDRFLKLAPTALEAPIAKSLLAAGGG